MNWKKSHRIVALSITIPLLFIALSGVVLQLRNQFEWIQPETISQKLDPLQSYISIEAATRGISIENVEQIILRPAKGNLSIRLKDGLEIQMHPQTGAILKKSMRRTNLLIDLHQGSWLGNIGQYGIHFITGILLFFLIISGIMIYPFPRIRR
jgi:uncharacterized iron-regulated membrane protein